MNFFLYKDNSHDNIAIDVVKYWINLYFFGENIHVVTGHTQDLKVKVYWIKFQKALNGCIFWRLWMIISLTWLIPICMYLAWKGSGTMAGAPHVLVPLKTVHHYLHTSCLYTFSHQLYNILHLGPHCLHVTQHNSYSKISTSISLASILHKICISAL